MRQGGRKILNGGGVGDGCLALSLDGCMVKALHNFEGIREHSSHRVAFAVFF